MDRTPLHRALIAAGMTYVGPAEAEKLAKAIEAEGLELAPARATDERHIFQIRINGGAEQTFEAGTSIYAHAAMEAFGRLGLPYPCTVMIWVPDLVEAGYGPYHFQIDDFVDSAGNTYGCPAVMRAAAPRAHVMAD